MSTQNLVSYEESVNWLRAKPGYEGFVKNCYLDRDNFASATRFAESEEFSAVSELLKLGQRDPSTKVLDLGCGNGIASYAFANLGFQVTAVDPDMSDDVGLAAANRLASRTHRGSIVTVQAMAETLPFPNATFDIIYERQALHHFSNLPEGLTECARVLKPGGLFLATREHVVNDPQQLEQFLADHILHQQHGGENAYPAAHYVACLEQAGLKVLQKIAPVDNVINHFPMSNQEIKQGLTNWLTRRLGKTLGETIAQSPQVEFAYRKVRSQRNQSPGRLYSFLCVKP